MPRLRIDRGMKTKNPQLRSRRNRQSKPARERDRRPVTQPKDSAHYRAEGSRHLITLDLGEGAFTALRVLAHVFNHSTPEDYALAVVHSDATDMLPQITEVEVKKFIESAIIESRAEEQQKNPTRQIVLTVPEKAYAIWHGCALRDGYDCIEHMILRHEAGMCAQSPGDHEEEEYYAMFGLKVDADGDTSMPDAPKSTLHPKRLEPLRIA
jgi:hypothetical protein